MNLIALPKCNSDVGLVADDPLHDSGGARPVHASPGLRIGAATAALDVAGRERFWLALRCSPPGSRVRPVTNRPLPVSLPPDTSRGGCPSVSHSVDAAPARRARSGTRITWAGNVQLFL